MCGGLNVCLYPPPSPLPSLRIVQIFQQAGIGRAQDAAAVAVGLGLFKLCVPCVCVCVGGGGSHTTILWGEWRLIKVPFNFSIQFLTKSSQ